MIVPPLYGRLPAVALAFADQTFPDDDWRSDNSDLAAWFNRFNQRPSMTDSVLIDAREFK